MDELVYALRNNADHYGFMGENGLVHLLTDAADAIESMSEYVNTMRRLKCEGWYLQQTKFHDGYHAIATMPLPQPPEEGE